MKSTIIAILLIHVVYSASITKEISHEFCQKEKTDKCNWNAIMNKYKYNFPSQVFRRENNEIVCENLGNWSLHSRPPCNIDKDGLGGVKYIYMEKCQLSLKKDNKLVCSIKTKLINNYFNARLNYQYGKLSCECLEGDDSVLLQNTCKWRVGINFKKGQEDWSPTVELIMGILFIVGVIFLIFICIHSENECGCFPIILGDFGTSTDDSFADLVFGETD